jgi:hypothetical protein
MPLTKEDVLASLADPVALGMDFWVGSVHIEGKLYRDIREHIRAENILVSEGDGVLAFYDNKTDVLTTQRGNSPANVFQKAQILHECTHALIDVFNKGDKVTRHMDEMASYIAQFVYTMRAVPSAVVSNRDEPWENFYRDCESLVKRFKLNNPSGNGARITADDVESIRIKLAGLPNVNYGDFKKEDLSGADGLTRKHPFIKDTPPAPPKADAAPKAAAPKAKVDASDADLVGKLAKRYAANDVAGYGGRLRALREEFALCSVPRAKELHRRLSARLGGDRMSELFYDHLSREGRAILLRVLKARG